MKRTPIGTINYVRYQCRLKTEVEKLVKKAGVDMEIVRDILQQLMDQFGRV